MVTKQEINERLAALVSDAHKYACSLDIGQERTEAFDFYEALRRMQRRGFASEALEATNPLLTGGGFQCDDNDNDDWDDEDDDD